MTDKNLTKPIKDCKVCGGITLADDLCNGCQEYKHRMEELRKTKARQKAFGNFWEEAGK